MKQPPILLGIAFLSLAASSAAADSGGPHPKIALHVAAHAAKSTIECNQWTVPCSDFVTAAIPPTPADVYLVLARGDSLGFAGLSCGLEYDNSPGQGVDVLTWTFCGDWQFPSVDWPESQSGSRMTWNTTLRCQNTAAGADGVHALAGVFYVYAYGSDSFRITEHPRLVSGPELQVADCMNNIFFLDPAEDVGEVRFSTATAMVGFNPCTQSGSVPGALPPPPVPPSPPPPPPGPVPPPTEPQDAAVVLHIGEANPRIGCNGFPASVEDVITAAETAPEGLPYYVYVLGAPYVPEGYDLEDRYYPGLTGLRFGIEYGTAGEGDGIRVFGWQSCAGSALTGERWPAPGSGITLTWGDCEITGLAVGGYFYVAAYSPAVMAVTPFPGKASVAFADCLAMEGDFTPLDIHRVGWLSLGGAGKGLDTDGCNPLLGPCNAPTAVERTTWGRIKTKFTIENGRSGQ
jgi:hypothetical protein